MAGPKPHLSNPRARAEVRQRTAAVERAERLAERLARPRILGRARILAIDPGYERSAWLYWEGGPLAPGAIDPNDKLLEFLRDRAAATVDVVVIEKIESFGMAVGREVFDTVLWAGRFTEAAHPIPVVQLPRREVKLAICHDSRAKDANIRAALIDRFGGVGAKGTKAHPGPLYGIAGDVWSALAIATTYADRLEGIR